MTSVTTEKVVQTIPVDLIEPDTNGQPRQTFPDSTIDGLLESILANGQTTPIEVSPHPTKKGHFEVVFGERRHRAHKKGGLPTILAIVDDREETLAERFERQLAENGQREDLNPIDEALAIQRLIELAGPANKMAAIAKAADHLGCGVQTCRKRLYLLELDPVVQSEVQNGKLPPTNASMLGQYGMARAQQIRLAHRIIDGRWSTARLRTELESLHDGDQKQRKTTTPETPKDQFSRILQFRYGIRSTIHAIEFVLELSDSVLAGIWYGLPERARKNVLKQLPQIARACDQLVARLTALKKTQRRKTKKRPVREVGRDGLIRPQVTARTSKASVLELLRAMIFGGTDNKTFSLNKVFLLQELEATEEDALGALRAFRVRWDDREVQPIQDLVAEIRRVHKIASFGELVMALFQAATGDDCVNLNRL